MLVFDYKNIGLKLLRLPSSVWLSGSADPLLLRLMLYAGLFCILGYTHDSTGNLEEEEFIFRTKTKHKDK